MNDSEISLEIYQKADADTKVAMVKDYIAKGTKNCEWLVKWCETKSTGVEYSLTVKDGELTRHLVQTCTCVYTHILMHMSENVYALP